MNDCNIEYAFDGVKAVTNILGVVNNITWAVIGFTTSGFWLGLLIWTVGALITGLLLILGVTVTAAKYPEAYASVGRGVHKAAEKVSSMFGSLRASN